MSRIRRFAHSLMSGCALGGANVLYTLASVPLALKYLRNDEFALWLLVAQVSGYLLLIDLGMSGSVSRILIDHKDDKLSTKYGAVIQTGLLVLLVQGLLIAAGGSVASLWMPELMRVPTKFQEVFRILMAGQCVVLGVSFVGRIFGHILQAHQRFDVQNYSQVGNSAWSLAGLWVGFELKLGLYSLLAGAVAGTLFDIGFCLCACWRLELFPVKGRWGRANWATFKELFFFGTDLFLMTIGEMLVNASQVVVISRTLGLEAAVVWSVATKTFSFAQQTIWRIFSFSSSALSEMVVRGERTRLLARFHDVVVLTASGSVLAGLVVALCNQPFLTVWVHGRVSWGVVNDLFMAISVAVYSTTRCHRGLVGLTKQIRAMKYVYLMEGMAFVALG